MRTRGRDVCVRYLRSEYKHKHKNKIIRVRVRNYWNKTKKDNDDLGPCQLTLRVPEGYKR